MISYTLTNPNPNITPSSPATFPLRFRSLLRPYSGARTLAGPVKASRIDPPDIEIKGEVTRLEDGDSVSFEERTVKFSKSGEDFEACFNKKSRVISKQTSKKMKIQHDIDVIVVEPVKDKFDASASTTDDMKDVWKTQDFHLGIPYCGMLSLGGVFSFMITGSICATRFNIILGGMFLALSIIGLRSLKEGNSSAIAVTGQADPPDIEIKCEVTRLEDGDSVSFEERTVKFSKSGEDFEVCFNKKSRVISKQTSKKMKIQHDIDVIVVEPVKDKFDASASTTDDMKDVWKTQDFHLGISYCGMLSLGGVFSFMITGSICATRFNIILGGMFLALSIIGLRSLKEGNSSAIAVTGQAAIVAVLFVRQARVMFMKPRFTSCIATLLSGVVVAFYIKRISYLMVQTNVGANMGTTTNN